MVDGFLLPTLALFTLLAAVAFGVWSKRRTDNLSHDAPKKKSSLAKDGPGPQPFR